MKWVRRGLRRAFLSVEEGLDAVFTPAWNPLYQLGALGYFCYWIVAVTGIYLYILFDTSVVGAYGSVEHLTVQQWYLGGVMRSLHRYASDAMVFVMAVHIAREFAFDRYRGVRWFSWITGVPIIWLVFAAGITGYWLVWDKLAQYVAIATTEWLDWLPIFGESIARNFISPESLDDRFFTLLVFLHIAVPLILLLVMWIHLQRMTRTKINPARGLMVGTLGMFIVLAFLHPAVSQGPADLSKVPAVVGLDWFYLGLYPLLDLWSPGGLWALSFVLTMLLVLLPWLPPARRAPVAEVFLEHCNGCARCFNDCPFAAITMGLRTDGRPFQRQAVVNPNLCASCGICVGACPSSTPFRRAAPIATGIDLPHLSLKDLHGRVHREAAKLTGGPRILVFGCDHGADVAALAGPGVAVVSLPCIGMLPPPFVDYVLSRDLADGVLLTGCRENACYYRLGQRWTEERLAGTRDPRLRTRVPRERITVVWAARPDRRRLSRELAQFAERLAALPPAPCTPTASRPAARAGERQEAGSHG